MSEKKKRRLRHATVIPKIDIDISYCEEEDWYWGTHPVYGELYIDENEEALYEGKVVVLVPTQRWVRNTETLPHNERPKYWVIEKEESGKQQDISN